ncbi:glycosyltransferase [Rhodopseudomonas sp. HC1]|uniref:glycosyltransferase n=1 Tax=Rhodopseudomonas infernalis TaxID=2897386 RepID=UPI001EE864FD|nr:glycosyltransferase [Rhodopseudomonas infernalis]MCG6205222.1 glycosyltransferase [Rhodopseudomonas infernalis]
MTSVLFVHNNLPGQYLRLIERLRDRGGFSLAGIGTTRARGIAGLKMKRYSISSAGIAEVHPFARRFDLECRRAEAVLYAAVAMRDEGFVPDVIFGHPGWGEVLPLKEVFPKARLYCYSEYFYQADNDFNFDQGGERFGLPNRVGLDMKNAATLISLAASTAGIAPTEWQRSLFPNEFQSKIKVIHDGIDTAKIRRDRAAELRLPDGRTLTSRDEVITYVARNLEPYRGYHILMRALPKILSERPGAQVVIIGGDGTSYGAPPPDGRRWKDIYLDEVTEQLPLDRVHFLGRVSYEDYLNVLGISSAHIYLTYPFVLSWSMLEAMASECLVIGSSTAPVEEVIEDRHNGLLVPFGDPVQLAETVIEALAKPKAFQKIRRTARQTVVDRFDFETRSWPQFETLLG